ncbi:MAG: OmpA family protein [Gammaproteobacteria bacterium]
MNVSVDTTERTSPRLAMALALALVLATAGCASREPLPELVTARQEVQAAAQDPEAAKAGALRLADAQEALAQAESAAASHKSDDVVKGFAYTATRNAQIARAQAAEVRNRAQVAQGEANRNAVLLDARTQEADAARAAAAANANAAMANARQADAATDEADRLKAEAARLKAELEALNAVSTDRGMVLTLGDVLFDTNRAVVKSGAMDQLARVAAFMQANSGFRLMVEGNTDNTGTDAYNETLSARRAEAVRDVLARSGVDRARIEATGRGEGYPVASNDTAEGRQQNRRVELIFSDQSGAFQTLGGSATR